MGMVDRNVPLALVTGAARRLGFTLADGMAKQGYAILLHYHTSVSEAAAAADRLTGSGVPVYAFQADLRAPDQIQALFDYIDTLPHVLRLVVNSAAVMPGGDVRTLTVEGWDAVLDLNLRAPFLVAQAAARRMPSGGLIVNLTDAGAARAWTGYPAYAVSKAALETLTRLLAKALAPGIRVNAIAPGLVLPAGSLPEGQWKKMIERLPQKRATGVDEVVMALEYLVLNKAVTGQTLVVDGGYTLA